MMDGRSVGCMVGWSDGQMVRWSDGWMVGLSNVRNGQMLQWGGCLIDTPLNFQFLIKSYISGTNCCKNIANHSN